MSLKRLNLILGWVVFAAALIIYGITMEKSASFWDCGEFIAAAHKLQVVHPPGAPVYLMLGRLFSFFLPPEKVAMGVNFLSAFSTALAAMFVFWSTTILGKRMLRFKENNHTQGEIIAILGAGLVAAFAFIFQDSQWFNAVEAEVYAVSTGLTAAVIYMALKWTEVHNEPKGDKWLMGIALVIGVSLGVHLLNLLAIPFIALLYYFYKSKKTTPKGIAIAFIIGAIILLFVQYGVILELPKLASGLEVFFVNQLGLPFGSGVLFITLLVFLIPILAIFFARTNKQALLYAAMGIIVFLALSQFVKVDSFGSAAVKAVLTAATAFALYYFRDNKDLIYKLAFGFLFVMMGYLSYLSVPIRSSANTPIDIYNPENVFNLLSYLNREQYGSAPLLYGPTYNSEVIGSRDAGKVYAKKNGKYEVIDNKIEYEFAPEEKLLFPRTWYYLEDSKDDAYNQWIGLNSGTPNFVQNLKFFFTYQLDFMYWRYFMWNFAGRQNSEQSHGSGDVGNWESGIPIADAGRTIQADVYPDTIKHNPSVNHFFFIPFVLGLLGLILQWRFSKNDAIATVGLFLLTGVAIVIYLNQPPLQPRERDYAYVGSFLAFAIWIGLSVPGLYRAARSMTFKQLSYILSGFSVIFVAMFVMGFGANNLFTLLPIALVVAILLAIFYVIAVSLRKLDSAPTAIALTLLAAIAPALMGFIGWEDHNRNNLSLARAVGANYLTSCNENAILFTEGDNDTYPLWYSQEVERTRPDVKIINNSLLKADWYADQIQQHNGNQPGVELTFDPEDYESGKREVIFAQDRIEQMSMEDLMRFIKSDDPRTKIDGYDIFPTRTFTIAIDKEAQIRNGLVSPEEADRMVDTMVIRLGKRNLVRDEFMIYDVIQKNINKRPIYFTGENLPSVIGFSPYTRREGASVRLLPILREDFGTEYYSAIDPPIDKEKTLAYFKDGMDWGNIENGVYLEDTGQRQVMRVMDYATNMVYEYADEKNKAKAMETYQVIKDKIFKSSVPKDNIIYIFKSTGLVDALLQIGENEEAYELAKQTVDSAFRQFQYVNTATQTIANEQAIANEMIRVMQSIQKSAEEYGNQEIQAYIENVLTPAE